MLLWVIALSGVLDSRQEGGLQPMLSLSSSGIVYLAYQHHNEQTDQFFEVTNCTLLGSCAGIDSSTDP